MLRRSAALMLATAATAWLLAPPDTAAAGAANGLGKGKGQGLRGPAVAPERAIPGREATRGASWRDGWRSSGPPGPAARRRGAAASSAGSAWRRQPRRGDLPAELRVGFEGWLRDSLAEALSGRVWLLPHRTGGPLPPGVHGLSSAFSTTNLQEAGVDESDITRFDGEFLYVALAGVPPDPGAEPARIRVLRAHEDPTGAEEVGVITVPGTSDVVGMYLLGTPERGDLRLLVVGRGIASSLEIPGPAPWDWGWALTTLHLFDVSDPAAAREEWSLVIEGLLVSTRRLDETLHMVTQASVPFRLPGLLSDGRLPAEDPMSDARAREAVMQVGDSDLLPRIVVDGGTPEPLVPVERCFLPVADVEAAPRVPTVLTVTSLDLRNPARRSSVCLSAYSAEVYSSTRSLYVATPWGRNTVVHKFAYTALGPQHRGAGTLEGALAGVDRGFAMGEHEGVLGALTDLGIEGDLGRHRLTLLRESRGASPALEEIARLPNADEPEPIGKPGDLIHGVRFLGARLYVVTFRRVDPLYAIDLSDPLRPRIAGQLEVPGFSDYLHPIGSDLLLGVGFDILNGFLLDGIKVELFDVSDPSRLESLGAITVGQRGSRSAALSDHHAVTHLPGPDGLHRFAVPIQAHDADPFVEAWPMHHSPGWKTGLYLFEVEEARPGTPAQLRAVGAVVATEPGAWPEGTDRDRSRIQGSAVHYVHRGQVWSAPWDAPEEAVGPQ